jgi:hypothetical protein
MNAVLVTIIYVASLVVLCLMAWGIISFVYWCIDKRDRKKWDIAVAKYPEVLDYQKEANAWWEAYDKKSDEANGYKKQIDGLIGNLCYLPSYEVEWRTEEAEEYKKLYFEARQEADRMYLHYCEAHQKVLDYLEEHKLRRWF